MLISDSTILALMVSLVMVLMITVVVLGNRWPSRQTCRRIWRWTARNFRAGLGVLISPHMLLLCLIGAALWRWGGVPLAVVGIAIGGGFVWLLAKIRFQGFEPPDTLGWLTRKAQPGSNYLRDRVGWLVVRKAEATAEYLRTHLAPRDPLKRR